VEANIFRGLAGELWIDQAQERLTASTPTSSPM